QLVGLPDIVDGGLTHALTLGHRAATPMRHAFGFGLQGRIHNGGDLIDVVVRFASASGSNLPQSVRALFREAFAPQDNGLAVDGQLLSDGHIGLSVRGGQHNPAAQGDLLRSAMGRHPLLNLLPLGKRHAPAYAGRAAPVHLFVGHYTSRAKLTYHERRADIHELQGVVTPASILASYGIDGKRSPTGWRGSE